MERFSEQFSITDLDRNAVSDLTAKWLWDRQKNGFDDFVLDALTINKADLRLTFVAKPTYAVAKTVDSVSVDGKRVATKGYYTQISYLNPEEYLGPSESFNSFSKSEQKQLLRDYIDEGMARIHCTCPAHYYQGHFEAMSSHDSDIYKFKGPKGTGLWRGRHSMGLSDNDITICKHVAAVIEQIHLFDDDIIKVLQGESWGDGGTVTTTTVEVPVEKDKVEVPAEKPEEVEDFAKEEKEPTQGEPDMDLSDELEPEDLTQED